MIISKGRGNIGIGTKDEQQKWEYKKTRLKSRAKTSHARTPFHICTVHTLQRTNRRGRMRESERTEKQSEEYFSRNTGPLHTPHLNDDELGQVDRWAKHPVLRCCHSTHPTVAVSSQLFVPVHTPAKTQFGKGPIRKKTGRNTFFAIFASTGWEIPKLGVQQS